MTPNRKRVLSLIEVPGTTSESPLHLHGADFKAAIWLFEQGFVGLIGRGFYPLSREEQLATAVLRLTSIVSERCPAVADEQIEAWVALAEAKA